MKYGRLKIEEAISLKMVMYGGFHGPVAWVNEMFYEVEVYVIEDLLELLGLI